MNPRRSSAYRHCPRIRTLVREKAQQLNYAVIDEYLTNKEQHIAYLFKPPHAKADPQHWSKIRDFIDAVLTPRKEALSKLTSALGQGIVGLAVVFYDSYRKKYAKGLVKSYNPSTDYYTFNETNLIPNIPQFQGRKKKLHNNLSARTLQLYDPNTNIWVAACSLPDPKANPCSRIDEVALPRADNANRDTE